MAEALGDAFQFITQALAQMQGAMWAMNEEMSKADSTICGIVRSLEKQEKTVQTLGQRMKVLEKKAICGKASCTASYPQQYHATCNTPTAQASVPHVACFQYSSDVPSFPQFSMPPFSCKTMPSSYPQSSMPPAYPAPVMTCLPQAYAPSQTPTFNTYQSASNSQKICQTKRQAVLARKLLKAVQNGKTKLVRSLLTAGANINSTCGSKLTPLHRAAAKAFADIVSLLLMMGADPNAKDDDGRTALHIAANNDYSGHCVALMVQAGADVLSKDLIGFTPLHYAAISGNEASAIALLAVGASKTVEDNDRKTPADVAKMAAMRKLLVPTSRRCC